MYKRQVYDGLHKISTTDAAGLTTYFKYDLFGRLAKTRCLNKIETYEYDSLGRLSKKIEPFENGQLKITCTEYDFLDRLTKEKIEDETGRILKEITYKYDVWGNQTHIIEKTQEGLHVRETFYNSDKKPIKTVAPDGSEVHLSYDYAFKNEIGQFVLKTTSVDSSGRQAIAIHNSQVKPVRTELRDAFGILVQAQDLVYSATGHVIRLINHEIFGGEEIRTVESWFEYQETDQLISMTYAKGLSEQQAIYIKYNKRGLRQEVTKSDGTTLNYEYDRLNRLVDYKASDESISYKYVYNVRNQITEVFDHIQNTHSELIYDKKGRLVTEKLANGISISYAYDLLNRKTSVLLPNDRKITYERDALYLKKIHYDHKDEQHFEHSYDVYDAAGLNLEATAINGKKITYRYDSCKRPLSYDSENYKINDVQYDQLGRLTNYHVQDRVGKFPVRLDYNTLDQLILEEGHQTHYYECDSLHRRLFKNSSPSTFNGLNQLLTNSEYTYDYDLVGNLIAKESETDKMSYEYDADNRLICVNAEKPVTYTYDAFHRRMSKTSDGRTLRYIYSGNDEIGAIDEKDEVVELRVLDDPQENKMATSVVVELKGKLFVPFNDFQGNIIGLSDLQGKSVETYRYTAFGETTIYDSEGKETAQSQVGNAWQFSNKRVDAESGFVYFGMRYYEPENGRWITMDPAGLIDGSNLYSFLHHNPIGAWDLYGLCEEVLQEEQAYHPLENIDSDLTNNSNDTSVVNAEISPEEFGHANEDEGLFLKRSGKTGDSYCCGKVENTGLGFLLMHGIMNSLQDVYSTAKQRSIDANGQVVNFTYNKSQGLVRDVLRSAGELFFYMDTNRVLNARTEIRDLLTKHDKVCIEPHSEGGIVVRNAIRGLTEEERKRIIIIGFAVAAYTRKHEVLDAKFYRSTRDIAPYFDVIGLIRCWDTIEVLTPHLNAPLFDHTIASPTYREPQRREVLKALKTYGGLT